MPDTLISKPTLGRSVRHTNKIGFLLVNETTYTMSVKDLYERYNHFFNLKKLKTMDNNFNFGVTNCYEYKLIEHNYLVVPYIKKLNEHVPFINQNISLTPQGITFFKHLEVDNRLDISNIEFVTSRQAEYYRNFLKTNPVGRPRVFTDECHRGDSLVLEVLLELEDLQEDTDIITITKYWNMRVKLTKNIKTVQNMLKSYLKRLKDIRAVFVYPKSKPYIYGLTQEGKKIAEISKTVRFHERDTYSELERWL